MLFGEPSLVGLSPSFVVVHARLLVLRRRLPYGASAAAALVEMYYENHRSWDFRQASSWSMRASLFCGGACRMAQAPLPLWWRCTTTAQRVTQRETQENGRRPDFV